MDTQFATKQKSQHMRPEDKLENIFFKIKDEVKFKAESTPIFKEFKNENYTLYYIFIRHISNFSLINLLRKIRNFKYKNKISNDNLMGKVLIKSIQKINNKDVIRELISEFGDQINYNNLIELCDTYINIAKDTSTRLLNNKEELSSLMNG
jgi:hypothetical protein